MSRISLSFVLGLGLVCGLMGQSASAQWSSYSPLDGDRTACGQNGRDGSLQSGRNGYSGGSYGYRNDNRYDNAQYGYDTSRGGNRYTSRYAADGYNNWDTSYGSRFDYPARGYDSYGRSSQTHTTHRFGRRGAYDDSRYYDQTIPARRTYDWRNAGY